MGFFPLVAVLVFIICCADEARRKRNARKQQEEWLEQYYLDVPRRADEMEDLQRAEDLAEDLQRKQKRKKIRAEMETALVHLLDELYLFDHEDDYSGETVGEQFYRDGIMTITILAGRNAGGGGGIQPQKLEKSYNISAGVAIDLKQKAIARAPRPDRSPARARVAKKK